MHIKTRLKHKKNVSSLSATPPPTSMDSTKTITGAHHHAQDYIYWALDSNTSITKGAVMYKINYHFVGNQILLQYHFR